jgi:ATP-dependent DNA helicase PIF1
MASTFDDSIKLTQKQQEAYDALRKGKSIFLTGPAGTGKTALIHKFCNERSRGVAITSTTGTSALLMGGSTFYSYLGIGIGDGCVRWLVDKIEDNWFVHNRWKKLKVLVIDEISMMNPELFDKLNLVAQHVRKCKKPWGGIQLLLSGDFMQLPVVKSDKFTFEAETWKESIDETICLTENVRQDKDTIFKNILARCRLGEHTDADIDVLNSRVGTDVSVNGVTSTRLYSKNVNVDSQNESCLDQLAIENEDLEFHEYEMSVNKFQEKIPDWLVEKAIKDCIAPKYMQLCVGAQVMLLVNMYEDDPDNMNKQLVHSNGSRGVIIDIDEDEVPTVRFTDGDEREIHPHLFEIKNQDNKEKIDIILTQVPLKVAYAITIHKSQGLTLDCAEVDISDCFCPGQAYVALSRVKSLDGLSLKKKIRRNDIKCDQKCLKYYKVQMGEEEEDEDEEEKEEEEEVKLATRNFL